MDYLAKIFRTDYLWMENSCNKVRSQQDYPGNNSGKSGSGQARKKAGEPAFAYSAFSEHHFESEKFHQPSRSLAAASDFPKAERVTHCYQTNYPAGFGGKVRSKRKTHHLSDKMVARRLEKGLRLLKHVIHKRWKNIASIDEVWYYRSHINGRSKIFYEFRGKKLGKLEENLCTEASTWNYVRRGNQHL